MAVKLAVEEGARSKTVFPYATWGAKTALIAVLLAIAAGFVLGAVFTVPLLLAEGTSDDGTSTAVNVVAQLGLVTGFLAVPILLATRYGAHSLRTALRVLGARPFRPSALKWMAASIGAYLLFAAVYAAIAGEPKQEDIAENFGSMPLQILLIAVAAPIGEEVCFRGMLFGGLRRQLPRVVAALVSGLVFGALHAVTGLSAVPPLVAFGFILALLYEKTGSIVPGVVLHMLNNSVALLVQ